MPWYRVASAGKGKLGLIGVAIAVIVILMFLFFAMGSTHNILNGLIMLAGVALCGGALLPVKWHLRIIFPIIGVIIIVLGMAM
jgi:hypothetical protein